MRRAFALLLTLAALITAVCIPVSAEETGALVRQDINYSEIVGRVNQSDSGFTLSSRYIYSSNMNAWAFPRDDSNFQFYYFGLERWSTDAGGKDEPIDEGFLSFIDGTLANLRANGGACIIRASYALDGQQQAEPQTFELLLQHQSQLASVFAKYPDIIIGVECGMIGAFGEMWGGKYSGAEYKLEVLRAWLDKLPAPIPVNVRTVAEYVLYVNESELFNEKYRNKIVDGVQYPIEFTDGNYANYLFEGEVFSRIGCYNDAMIQDGNDGGTFSGGRENFIKWMNMRGSTTSYGGEFSGADGQYRYNRNNWLPLIAIPEFYSAHLTYYHGGNAAYENTGKFRPASEYTVTFDSVAEAKEKEEWFLENFEAYSSRMSYSCTREGNVVTFKMGGWQSAIVASELFDAIAGQVYLTADLSAYEYESVSDFFEDHLGYRIVLKDSVLSGSVDRGGVLTVKGTVDNTGFANISLDKVVEIFFTNGDETYTVRTDIDPKEWVAATRNNYSADIKLPASIAAGEYDVYMRVAGVDPEGNTNPGGVRFANPGKYTYQTPGSDYSVRSETLSLNYNSALDGNYLGTFTVTGDSVAGADDTIGQLCTVEFHTHDGQPLAGESVLMGGSVTAPTAPERESTECVDYTFECWVDEDGRVADLESVTENMSLVAYYSESGTHNNSGEWTVDVMPEIGKSGQKWIYCADCGESLEYCAIDAIEAVDFPDLDTGAWYYNAVAYAVNNDLFNGLSEVRFAPNNAMNRAMLVSVLYRMEGSPDVTDLTNPFGDVTEARYYYEAVLWAADKGVVNGTGENTFSPNDPVTREQMAAILYRYARGKGYDMSVSADLADFPDASSVGSYAESAMVWAYEKGLITGSKNNGIIYLDPKGGATRAQVATILMRYRLRF